MYHILHLLIAVFMSRLASVGSSGGGIIDDGCTFGYTQMNVSLGCIRLVLTSSYTIVSGELVASSRHWSSSSNFGETALGMVDGDEHRELVPSGNTCPIAGEGLDVGKEEE